MKVERRCKIVSKTRLNDATVYMVLEVGDMVRTSFRAPGQFVHIKCGDGLLLRRPISVCSCTEDEPDDTLAVIFEVRGEGTAWLARRSVGHTVDVLGLLGNGFQIKPEGRYLLAGGGVGVPPLLGCAQYTRGRSTAALGFRCAGRAILMEQFEENCAAVLTASDDGTLGRKGFTADLVREELARDSGYDAVIACGPRALLMTVSEAAAEYGVPCQVSMEERMACGVGACLGCAVKMADGTMKHVCSDGPVFDAREVDWSV